MKQNFLLFFLIFSINTFSQEESKKDSLWTTRGNVAILLNQTGFSDWVGGGTNNFSGTLKFDYEWEYKDKGWWAEGQIDDSAFVQGIEFLVKSGIIQVR